MGNLVTAGRLANNQADGIGLLEGMPFDLELEHYEGNCDLCFLKRRNKIRRLLLEQPELAEWWIRQEEKVGGSFRKGMPVQRFMDLIRATPALFDYDDTDIECFCNAN